MKLKEARNTEVQPSFQLSSFTGSGNVNTGQAI